MIGVFLFLTFLGIEKVNAETYTGQAIWPSEHISNIFVRKYRNDYFYDENLRKMDLYNYNLINEIYDSSISVITECSNYGFIPVKQKVTATGLTWIIEKLKELNKYEYTYDELESIFEPLFKEHNLKWNKNTSIKIFFPEFEKTRRQVKGIRSTIYKFK